MYSNIHDSSSVCSYLYMKFVLDIVHPQKKPYPRGWMLFYLYQMIIHETEHPLFFLSFVNEIKHETTQKMPPAEYKEIFT